MASEKPEGQKAAHITIFRDWCKACGICAGFCPSKVYDRDAEGRPVVARPEACTRCRLCELRCPDFCIEVESGEEAA